MEKGKKESRRLSRRDFLRASGALIAAGGVTLAHEADHETLEALAPHTPGPPLAPSIPVISQYPGVPSEVPFAPAVPPSPQALRFFTLQEARTVEAIAARIIPGDEDDPGAREAGVVNYIDYLLAHNHGWNEPVYRFPPYAEAYEGDEPPEDNPYQVIWVQKDELERYGYQSALTPREMYRAGLIALDRYANETFGGDFVDLAEDKQDSVLEDLEDGEVDGFAEHAAEEFFDMLQQHTVQGMFADPAYGGNRDLVGWKMLDYPGAQRSYTPREMLTEGHDREPQSMAQLDHMHPGQPGHHNIVLPVFEEEEERQRR